MTKRTQKAAELAAAAAVGDAPDVPEIIEPPTGTQDPGDPPTPASAYHFYLIPLDADHKPILGEGGLPEHIEVCCNPDADATDVQKLEQIAASLSVIAAFAAGGMGIKAEALQELKAQRATPTPAAASDPEFRGKFDG